MLKRTIAVVMLLAAAALFAGCSGNGNIYQEETLLDRNWGRSVETAKHNQILDPEAGKVPKPVEGLSGVPAGYTVQTYEESFKEKTVEQTGTTTIMNK